MIRVGLIRSPRCAGRIESSDVIGVVASVDRPLRRWQPCQLPRPIPTDPMDRAA